MIPPIAPALLASNPKFEKLHLHLITNALDPDASTTAPNATRQSVTEQLQLQRIHAAEDSILTASLYQICTSEEFPKDLHDLVLIIASYVSDAGRLGLTKYEHELMSEDMQAVRERAVEVAEALVRSLSSKHETLASVAYSAKEASSTSRIPKHDARYMASGSQARSSDLRFQIYKLTSSIDRLRTQTLPSARYEVTNCLISLLRSQAQHLQHLIRHLEQRKHGAEARHLIARSQFLSTVAQGLEAKTKVTYLEQRRDTYSPQLRQKLASKMNELDEEEVTLAARRRDLQAALDEYEDLGGDVMRKLGKKYAEVEEEIEEVKRDVERLSHRGTT